MSVSNIQHSLIDSESPLVWRAMSKIISNILYYQGQHGKGGETHYLTQIKSKVSEYSNDTFAQ